MKVESAETLREPPLLDVADLDSRYGRIQVLHGITLQVQARQMVAIIGSNGAGKTTLLRAISGVQPITSGSIAFGGRPLGGVSSDKRVRLGICQVPEGRQVFSPMTVTDNLLLGAYARRGGPVRSDLDRMFSLFPVLAEKRNELAGNLSGGQQQMVAMARALMAHPQLLLLDEPSMGLSPIMVGEVFEIIERLRSDGVTILLVEQNAHRALSIADVAYVLESGKVALSGPARDLRDDPQIQRAYLGG